MVEDFLNITNTRSHPTNPNYELVWFKTKPEADYFEKKILELGVHFERENATPDHQRYYFAIRKNDLVSVNKINYETLGAHRKPLISSKPLAFFIVTISIIVLTLAIVGFVKSNG